jgi:hypothetical protein
MQITTKQLPCYCRSFEFGEFDGENENAVSYDTDCDQVTTRVFAQGHDAKLAGFLVRAEMAGEEIRVVEGGVAISGDARSMARRVSEPFEAKVVALIDAARRRVAKKALADATKAARKSAKTAERKLAEDAGVVVKLAPIEARIKVGRWEYDAQIDRDTREATYAGKLGGSKTVAEGKYSVL